MLTSVVIRGWLRLVSSSDHCWHTSPKVPSRKRATWLTIMGIWLVNYCYIALDKGFGRRPETKWLPFLSGWICLVAVSAGSWLDHVWNVSPASIILSCMHRGWCPQNGPVIELIMVAIELECGLWGKLWQNCRDLKALKGYYPTQATTQAVI